MISHFFSPSVCFRVLFVLVEVRQHNLSRLESSLFMREVAKKSEVRRCETQVAQRKKRPIRAWVKEMNETTDIEFRKEFLNMSYFSYAMDFFIS